MNHRRIVKDDSFGFWRRILLIPFLRTCDADKQLQDALSAEAEGVLLWAVQGCLAWQQEGLNPPNSGKLAANQHRAESDPLAEFLQECCTVAPGAVCRLGAAVAAYGGWCDAQGITATDGRLGFKGFGMTIGERFEREHRQQGSVYLALDLRQKDEDPAVMAVQTLDDVLEPS